MRFIMVGVTTVLVLDVGCGATPAGNVNVDLMIPDDSYNQTIRPKEITNFVKADANYLPFRKGAFHIARCSHLLEHVETPARTIAEMARVSSKRLILIVPFFPFEIASWLRSPWKYFWARKHHKTRYWCQPFNGGSTRFNYIGFKSALILKVNWNEKLKFPVPFETETWLDL